MDFFGFKISDICREEISIVTQNLLPENLPENTSVSVKQNVASKVNLILDELGSASAKAQGLIRPITSGEKLKLSDQVLYLLVDLDSHEGKGSAVGLLKIGRKKLFMFDLAGYQHEVEPLCILDFYIHESKQRTGCGKKLFEYMLQHQGVLPEHLAIDRPSEKFLSFLYRHYGLEHILPQMNNFVVFNGFLIVILDIDAEVKEGNNLRNPCNGSSSLQVTRRGNNQMSSVKSTNRNSAYDLASRCSVGRFSAYKPESTMGLILHDGMPGCPRSEMRDDALNGSSQNEHSTFVGEDSHSSSTPTGFLQQRSVESTISEDKSAFRHSRLW